MLLFIFGKKLFVYINYNLLLITLPYLEKKSLYKFWPEYYRINQKTFSVIKLSLTVARTRIHLNKQINLYLIRMYSPIILIFTY